jgi:Subtilase family
MSSKGIWMSSAKKTLSVDLAAWLLAGTQLVSSPAATIVLSASISALVLAGPAQAQVDDDEDDDDEDEDPVDDGDILDDDPADDPGGDDPGAGDVGDDIGDDIGDDVGDDVGGAGDDGGDDSGDDGSTGDDGGDDTGDDGGTGDDGEDDTGDDGGSGDDGGTSGDDGPGIGGRTTGDDDESGSSGGNSNDDDDAPGGAGVRGVSPSSGSGPKDPDEKPDTRSGSSDVLVDDEGYPLADKDILTFDLGPTDLSILKEIGFRVVEQTRLDGLGTSLQKLRPPSGMSMPDAADALRDSLPAAPFDYNHVFGLPASDKLEDEGRKIQKVGGKRSGEGAIVAMIDTLVDPKHPSLSTRKIVIKDFASSKKGRDFEHGTAVASIIVGFDPDTDYRGIVPGAKLLAANVFSISKEGVPETDTKALIEALDWAASQGAGVINFSIAGPPSDILEAAVKRLTEKGHIVTAAVGNDGPAAPPVFPATYSDVVGVTAVDIDGKIYRRAGRGAQVDIAAPGVKILAAGPNGTYSAVTGTSFATPVVSALLSLENPIPGKDASKRAEAFTQEARDLGASGADPTFGHGLVQIEIEEVN